MATIVRNGVDYSAGRLTGQQIANSGNDFCCRYLSEDWRGLEQTEVDSFRAAGIGIVIIGEYDTIDANGNQVSAMLGGAAAGTVQAVYADSIRKARGLPDKQPIYFTLDVEPGSVDWSLVAAYLKSTASVLGGVQRVGLYGGYDAIEFASANGLAAWFWQTYSWSRGLVHPKAHLYQYDIFGNYVDSVDVDLNKAFTENYGQAQMFEVQPPANPWTLPLHPDWFVSSLSVRYPTVGRWLWKGQILVLDTVRHNAHVRRRTNQYSEPTMASGHAGPLLAVDTKVNVERITDVEEVKNGKTGKRTWVLTGNGTWIPEDTLDIDFTVKRRKPRSA